MKYFVTAALAGIAMGCYGARHAYEYGYSQGYQDGIQYSVDTIKYELHKDSRARLIQETEDLQSTPEA